MTDFDYVIRGGGCAGLSLAYELESHRLLENKRLAILEPRKTYQRDKTWSFWAVGHHSFEDCVTGRWSRFEIIKDGEKSVIDCANTPYESIDSGRFYTKVLTTLKKNPRIEFFHEPHLFNDNQALVFDSVPGTALNSALTWQHFKGIEIETPTDVFDAGTVTLMDFDCEQRGAVHFFYVLPFGPRRALIETTWFAPMTVGRDDYDHQLRDYIKRRYPKIEYAIAYDECGAIPLFDSSRVNDQSTIHIGSVGGMTRLSTGYAFLNIQEHSRYLRRNIEKVATAPAFQLPTRYRLLDQIFLNVLAKNPEIMPTVFRKFFSGPAAHAIAFLSNCGNWRNDLQTILKMPKGVFLKSALGLK